MGDHEPQQGGDEAKGGPFMPFGEDYLESYREIPDELIADPYLSNKKLGGYRRLFSPGDPGEVRWFQENREKLVRAHGEEAVSRFFLEVLGIEDESTP